MPGGVETQTPQNWEEHDLNMERFPLPGFIAEG